MKKFLLYLWQLPQNLMGLAVIAFTKAHPTEHDYYFSYRYGFGVSLGTYIIFGKRTPRDIDVRHEQGHQKQSLYLGPLYLLLIGLPSVLGNLWDRIFHAKWSAKEREKWYYSLIWEAGADSLGKVTRWELL